MSTEPRKEWAKAPAQIYVGQLEDGRIARREWIGKGRRKVVVGSPAALPRTFPRDLEGVRLYRFRQRMKGDTRALVFTGGHRVYVVTDAGGSLVEHGERQGVTIAAFGKRLDAANVADARRASGIAGDQVVTYMRIGLVR
jgi:hypothetical protein